MKMRFIKCRNEAAFTPSKKCNIQNYPELLSRYLVSHNSPRGIHDRNDDVHYGFDALNSYIARANPRFIIHGHQHVNRETETGATRVIGVFGFRIIDI